MPNIKDLDPGCIFARCPRCKVLAWIRKDKDDNLLCTTCMTGWREKEES